MMAPISWALSRNSMARQLLTRGQEVTVTMANVKVTKTETPAIRPFYTPPLFPLSGLLTWNPFELMDEFVRNTDRAFHFKNNGATEWLPALECKMTDNELLFTAELPGLKPEDVKVEITGDRIVIQGEKKAETKEEKEGYYRTERRYGNFYREMTLPEGAKADAAKAEIANGVLTVKVPITAPALPPARTVPVEAAKV